MARKFNRSCPKGGTCLVDVIISEYAIANCDFTRKDLLRDLPSLKLTPRQVSYRLAYMVKNGTLIKEGQGNGATYNISQRPDGMYFYMNLNPAPFEAIKSGKKTVEMRLNDNKRRALRAGDLIVFTNTETKEEMIVEILDKIVYTDFHELYKHHNKISIGYSENETADPDDMLEYYDKKRIKKYGALAIVIRLSKKQSLLHR